MPHFFLLRAHMFSCKFSNFHHSSSNNVNDARGTDECYELYSDVILLYIYIYLWPAIFMFIDVTRVFSLQQLPTIDNSISIIRTFYWDRRLWVIKLYRGAEEVWPLKQLQREYNFSESRRFHNGSIMEVTSVLICNLKLKGKAIIQTFWQNLFCNLKGPDCQISPTSEQCTASLCAGFAPRANTCIWIENWFSVSQISLLQKRPKNY